MGEELSIPSQKRFVFLERIGEKLQPVHQKRFLFLLPDNR
jgi:hypothetical protein